MYTWNIVLMQMQEAFGEWFCVLSASYTLEFPLVSVLLWISQWFIVVFISWAFLGFSGASIRTGLHKQISQETNCQNMKKTTFEVKIDVYTARWSLQVKGIQLVSEWWLDLVRFYHRVMNSDLKDLQNCLLKRCFWIKIWRFTKGEQKFGRLRL